MNQSGSNSTKIFHLKLLAFSFMLLANLQTQRAYAESCSAEFNDSLKPIHTTEDKIRTENRAEAQEKQGQLVSTKSDLISSEDLDRTDVSSELLTERKFLTDLLINGEDNLAMHAPFTVMSAAQRMLAIIYSQGVERVSLPITGEMVDFYPFFSSGTVATNGRRIVGHEKLIAEVVNLIKAQAAGDRSAVAIPLLVGSHGTGKSEFLTLLRLGAEYLTSQVQSPYSNYTYSWIKLGEIDSLHPYIPASDLNGVKVYSDLEAANGESPIVLLPPSIQNAIFANAKSAVQKLTKMDPAPFLMLDPASQYIRNEIVIHYGRQRGHTLTTAEVVEVLNKHTTISRQVIGNAHGRMPLIDKQGDDLDVQGLFMAPNPVVRFASGKGPTHPMAWYYNGKILKGHGNATFFDEFPRNPTTFQDMLLGAFESRVLSVGGAPTVGWDSVVIAAGNSANLNEIKKSDVGAASIDRFLQMPMRWPALPNEVSQLLLLAKSSDLYEQDLTSEGQPVKKGSIDDLFPRQRGLARMLTSDHRYRVWFGTGVNKVELAPHALLMMSEIIAATRMETSQEKASQVFGGKITGSNLLRNPIDRLRLLEGLRSDVNRDEVRELTEVGTLLKEGEAGISSRDAGKWLTKAIQSARDQGGTLTPGIMLQVFRDMLAIGSITAPSNKVRLDWLGLADEIVGQLLIPRLDSDISKAIANGDRVVNDAYFDLIEEMFAIHQNPNSTTYVSGGSGQERSIDRQRLTAVSEIYKKKNGRALNISQIAIFHAQQKSSDLKAVGRVPDETLLDSISEYYAALNTQVAGFGALIEFEKTGNGNDDVRAAHSSLVRALKGMGYNDISVRDALMQINDHKSRAQQEKEPKQ